MHLVVYYCDDCDYICHEKVYEIHRRLKHYYGNDNIPVTMINISIYSPRFEFQDIIDYQYISFKPTLLFFLNDRSGPIKIVD